MKSSLENILKRKLEVKPDKSFEQSFWETFYTKNPPKKVFDLSFAIPTFSLALLVVLFLNLPFYRPKFEGESQLMTNFRSLAPILEDLDFYVEVDEDLIELSDEEWGLLLEEGS